VPPEIPTTTTTEWWAAAIAAALIVGIASLHVLRLAPDGGTRDRLARLTGWLLASVGGTFTLVAAALLGASVRASMVSQADIDAQQHLPMGPFVRHLLDPDLPTTERVGPYSAAFLLPLAVAFGVLAVAVVDPVRSAGIRIAALASSLVVALGSLYLALGTSTRFDTDPGPLAARVATSLVVVSGLSALALTLDLVRSGSTVGPDRRR
jgi:hypothetical protein